MIKNLYLLQLIKKEMQIWENFNFAFYMSTRIACTHTPKKKKRKKETHSIVFIGFYFSVSQILNTSIKIFTALCDSAGLRRAYEAIDKILVR